jgi:hypothetical protein
MDTTALHTLLDANLALPPEYRDQLSNHLPMALHALHGLGADAARLHEFFGRYAQRFGDRCAPQPSPAVTDWARLIGQPEAYAALRASFEAALHEQGRDAVLGTAVPLLVTGVGGAAFHGLIRTGHAIEAGHDGELAAALAYWGWRWMPLAAAPAAGAALDADDWTAALMQKSAGWRSPAGLISRRMQDAQHSPAYQALAGRLRFAPDTLARLSAFAARRYAQTGNFTVLHMVTASRALRVVTPWLGAAPPAPVAQAFAAAWLASGAGAAVAQAAPPRTWPEVVALALASDDDHVVKLVHACGDEAQVHGNGPWLAAATRATAGAVAPQAVSSDRPSPQPAQP